MSISLGNPCFLEFWAIPDNKSLQRLAKVREPQGHY